MSHPETVCRGNRNWSCLSSALEMSSKLKMTVREMEMEENPVMDQLVGLEEVGGIGVALPHMKMFGISLDQE